MTSAADIPYTSSADRAAAFRTSLLRRLRALLERLAVLCVYLAVGLMIVAGVVLVGLIVTVAFLALSPFAASSR